MWPAPTPAENFADRGTFLGAGQLMAVSLYDYGNIPFLEWSPDRAGQQLPSNGEQVEQILRSITFEYDFRGGSTKLTSATCEPAPPEPLRTLRCDATFADGSSGGIEPFSDGKGHMVLGRDDGVGPAGPDDQWFDGSVVVPPDDSPGTLAARRVTPPIRQLERMIKGMTFVAGTRRAEFEAVNSTCERVQPGDPRMAGVMFVPEAQLEQARAPDQFASNFVCRIEFDDGSTSQQRVDVMPGGRVYSSNLYAVPPAKLRTSAPG